MEHLASFGAGARANVFEDDQYSRLLNVEGELYLAQVRSEGTVEQPRLEVTFHGSDITDQALSTVKKTLTWILGGDTPLTDFYTAAHQDPVLDPSGQKTLRP